jgi:hypothetical protein
MNQLGPDGGGLSVDYSALEGARTTFEDLAAQFQNSREPLAGRRATLLQGCGQVSAKVDAGATAFVLSWQAAFDVASQSAGLIAGNIGGYAIDLAAVDVDSTVQIEL